MGEVYRATDTNLKRSVAIKVLPQALATDPERLARFQREAEVLAALNHPNIAGIYGLERANGVTALVMELVEGPTLADRISAGPLGIDEAIPIARQVADAVQAAHEQGIVHRDLKPANIKVRRDGTVKVLDFGLAKALESTATANSVDLSTSPTITTPAMTQAGMILGTAAYMSPEQAKGRPVDRRTDVWAFGCVFYEMLTARRAFEGEDVTDTIAAIVRGQPDWSALPAETPYQIRTLLTRCLEKDRQKRIADLSVAQFLMGESIDAMAAPGQSQPAAAARPTRRLVGGAAALGLAGGLVVAGLVAWRVGMFANPPPVKTIRFTIVPPATHPLFATSTEHDVVFSPDGSRIVYRAGTSLGTTLVVRDLNGLDVRPLAIPGSIRGPFFSPDGRWIGFFAGRELRKISVAGGPAITICTLDGLARGASWGDDDQIVFATVQGGLQQVSAGGGAPKVLVSSSGANALQYAFPINLPGGRGVLFTARSGFGADPGRIDVLDRHTGEQRTIIQGGNDVAYLDSGHLIYAEPMPSAIGFAALRAVRFDLDRLALIGDPVAVVDRVVASSATGAAEFAVSRRGDLLYVPYDPRAAVQGRPRTLVWVNRRGQEEPIEAPERTYAVARISPDGSRIALDVRDQTNDIWIWDIARRNLTPLNRDGSQDMSPLWTADGRRVIWTSTRGGGNPNLYWQSADGTGNVERLTSVSNNQFPTSIAPDGSHVIVFAGVPSGINLFNVAMQTADRRAEPLVEGAFTFLGGEISPDGRWLAYHSNESGDFQVYVRPYPKADSARFPVSARGGSRPAWARSGRELFYLDREGLLTSVPVETKGETFSAGQPSRVLQTRYYAGTTSLGIDLRAYDVTADGQRFLMIKDTAPESGQPTEVTLSMVVIANWLEELKARLPAR